MFTDHCPTTSDILGNQSLISRNLFRVLIHKKATKTQKCPFQVSAITRAEEIPPTKLTVKDTFSYLELCLTT